MYGPPGTCSSNCQRVVREIIMAECLANDVTINVRESEPFCNGQVRLKLLLNFFVVEISSFEIILLSLVYSSI